MKKQKVTVDFEVLVNSFDHVWQSSMEKIIAVLIDRKFREKALPVEITDSTGKVMDATFLRDKKGFYVCCWINGVHNGLTSTSLMINWMNGQHRELNYDSIHYSTN